jgi:hypothetical protein
VKYNWAFKLDMQTFRYHKFRFTFERLAKEYPNEWEFKQAVGFYLYTNPKNSLRGMIRPNGNINASLERFDNLYGRFETNYGKFIDHYHNDDLEGAIIAKSIEPESAAIMYDFFAPKFDRLIDSKIRDVKLIPKFSAFVGYDRSKIAAIVKRLDEQAKKVAK